MKTTTMRSPLAAALCLCAFAHAATADERPLDLTPAPTQWLASSGVDDQPVGNRFADGEHGNNDSTTAFEAPLFSGNKVHQYFGIGALGLLALAIISPKEENGPHEYFATGSAVLGAAAATSGLIYHWDDFNFDDGFSDPDNLHMMLGSAGTLLMLAAISQAPEGGHPALGIAGGVAMGIAVKMTW